MKDQIAQLREKIAELVRNSPAKAAMILTDWVNKEVGRSKSEISGKRSTEVLANDRSELAKKRKAG